jgi:hypothetical protein
LNEEVLREHLAELAKTVSPIYERVASLGDSEAQREAGRLADWIVSEQLEAPAAIPTDAAAVRCLRRSVEATKPDRGCMTYLLESFPKWMASLSSSSRAEFLENFPNLAPAARDLSDKGMGEVIEAIHLDPKLLGHVAAYATTTAEAVRAVARIAQRAANHHRGDLLEKLVEVFPATRMEESKEAEQLLPAMAEATEAVADIAWIPAMELALALAARDVSSARGTLRALPGSLSRVPQGDKGAYLDDFRLLVESIGIRVNGVCLKELPDWYSQGGSQRTREFVSMACETARKYGVLSGQFFLERKTAAARQRLNG